MKAISSSIALGILLVSLLGFLGCGGNSDARAAADPGEANPIAPFGIIDTMAPTFIWTPVPGVTEYRLMVQDANNAVMIDELYTVEESGCSFDEAMCKVQPDVITVGEHAWKVKACFDQSCGPWSVQLQYEMRPTPVNSADRYSKWGDGTITDNNTGLSWTDHTYSTTGTWHEADNYCENLVLGGYTDWYLPELYEISSLRDECSCHYLPEDGCRNHPMFRGIHIATATKVGGGHTWHYSEWYGGCATTVTANTEILLVWCARRTW